VSGKKKKKIIAVDFDGVIAMYDGWKGEDVLGEPNEKVIRALRELKENFNWYITVFTTRRDTMALRDWLNRNKVPHDSVNSTSHNPPNTSSKPIFDVMLDDRALRYEGQETKELLRQIIGSGKNRDN